MIDIETLGKKPGAVVLSVGCAVMDMEQLEIVEKAYWVLDLKEQQHQHIDPETVIWWMQQTDDARAAFRKLIPKTDAATFKNELQKLFDKYNTKTPWANGTNFDLPILGQYIYNLFSGPGDLEELVPWGYRWQDMRSLATVMAEILPYSTFYVTNASVAHNALDDAVRQAEYVLEVKKWIRAHSHSTPA
jgi:hypothetical protein